VPSESPRKKKSSSARADVVLGGSLCSTITMSGLLGGAVCVALVSKKPAIHWNVERGGLWRETEGGEEEKA